jgi:membrane-bound lytic murein transglycosylase D
MRRASSGSLAVLVASFVAGCAHSKPVAPSIPPKAGVPTSAQPEDPTEALIRAADAHLQQGIAEDQAGHLNKAREAFDAALDVYLTAPGGAYAHPRLAEQYRRTLETIQLLEFEALAAGDGFTETPPEPAAIDEVADLPVATAELSEETRRTAEEAVSEERNDLPILLNDSVLACIDLYQGALRDWFGEALARGGRYLPRIREVFASEGIPQDLAYVALVESAFKTQALSRAKAKGVWQFIPATGRRFGLSQDWWIDERSDPDKSTRAAAQYLKALYQMFGDWNLALAAYNAGEGKVRRGINRHGTDDYWELRERPRALARETRNYVPMIHAAIVVAKAPDKYGFEITPESPVPFDTVTLDHAFDLRVVAECAGSEVDEVRALNPELRRMATPANRRFPLKVPHGASEKVSTCLAELPPEKRVTFRTHVVARGETLSGLARRYGTRAQEISAANGLRPGRRLARGTELIIPVAGRPPAPARRSSTARTAEMGRGTARGDGMVRISYRVRAGDTLSSIATRYHTTVGQLRSWNKGLRGSRIAAGNTLTVYTRRAD